MPKLVKMVSGLLLVVAVGAFSLAAAFLLLVSIVDPEVAGRGGFLYALAPAALALVSFFTFRAMMRWADRQDRELDSK